jgi:hypothetical protein
MLSLSSWGHWKDELRRQSTAATVRKISARQSFVESEAKIRPVNFWSASPAWPYGIVDPRDGVKCILS